MKRLQLELTGIIQGVGFRPCVYRIAQQCQLTGWVKNTADGVVIEVQGLQAETFYPELLKQLPVLAQIIDYKVTEMSTKPEQSFQIHSSEAGKANTMINPDVCICDECLYELFDKQSRFYYYPFLNCTDCGPRYSIVNHLPYDRQQTTMNKFSFCRRCENDYADVNNRRYHAQPSACHDCGPQLSSSLEEINEAIKQGRIVALKGLGGYQLILDATNEHAVELLRERKQRSAKPFAVMCLNTASAKQWAAMDGTEEQLLSSWQRPIVLARQKQNSLSEAIAPGLNQLGIMLPSTPLHYLLFHSLLGKPDNESWLHQENKLILIVTSANISGEPLITDDQQALQELTNIADITVDYNRDIVTRVDDSVVKVIAGSTVFIRRARAYTPQAIQLAREVPCTLALGGHLKATICITRGDQAYLSQHIGDMTNRKTLDFYHETTEHLLEFLAVQPERIACDQHPDFYTSQLAQDFQRPVYKIQHHHAHLGAVVAEHQLNQPVLGLALDGYGYGEQGNAWGGELLLLQQHQYQHLGQLQSLSLLGGDRAAGEPWRMAASLLAALGKADSVEQRFQHINAASTLVEQLNSNHGFAATSSCGRWFDAISALLGVCDINQYEGQAAMMLESLVKTPRTFPQVWQITDSGLDLLPLANHLLDCEPGVGADYFHGTLASALMDWLMHWSENTQIQQVVLSGGCFINRILTEELFRQAKQTNLRLYLPRQAPINDAGIALGQAWLAAIQ